MRDIKAMLPEEIAAALAEMGQPKYRAKQIFQWLARGVTSFDEMTNLSKDLRAALSERFYISKLEMLRKQVSAIDGTIKYLWQLGDGNAVEQALPAGEEREKLLLRYRGLALGLEHERGVMAEGAAEIAAAGKHRAGHPAGIIQQC